MAPTTEAPTFPEIGTTAWPTPTAVAAHRLTFHGRFWSLFGIHIVNVFLTLLTLGVYYFWAKVRVRRYIFGQAELDGDRFAFEGWGLEMLLGFIKAAVIFGLPITALNYAPLILAGNSVVGIVAPLAAYGLVLVFLPVARAGARRYRLSRTSWRGIRFSFRGRSVQFIRVYAVGAILTALTAGLYYPVFATRNHAFLTKHSYVGGARFDFDGRGTDLVVSFLYAVLLTLPTFGLVWFWFAATKRRYLWQHTFLGRARFRCMITGGRLLRLKLGNLMLTLFTLGLGWPLITIRNARFVCRHIWLDGVVDTAAIQQELQTASATGEGLLGLFEADLDLG
ncbi:MAG TPA: YjgN family protein [Methylomirabilota bacterium]